MTPLTIIGGGLAGLTLGIALRQHNVPVNIIEAGHYPRHRVCGEFISGRGRDVLRRLDLEKKFLAAGANEARSAAFYSGRGRSHFVGLPEPALCLSRYDMDEILAREFRLAGGSLEENHRWAGREAPGIIHATGRRTQPTVEGWRWFGLKAHARQVELAAALEVHLLANGYVGLCQLNADTVNICGLFRSRTPVPGLARNWKNWLIGPEASPLRRRLARAEFFPGTFCSVAGLSLLPQAAICQAECRIGDAITMIAPLAGNGMSMAFESAELALLPLLGYSRGKASWSDTIKQVASQCDSAFTRRLRWAFRLQQASLHRSLSDAVVWLCGHSPALWGTLFQLTR